LGSLVQVGLVVLDRKQVGASGLHDKPGQRPLAEQGVAGQKPQRRVGGEQLAQMGLEDFRLGFLAVADGPLRQAEAGVVGEDVEDMDGVAVGVVALLAGLAIHGRRPHRFAGEQAGQPAAQGVLELGQGVAGRDARQGGGVRGVAAGEA
jgi:hypothetical protein